MKIFAQQQQIQTGITRGGSFYVSVKVGNRQVIRTTGLASKFLQLMTELPEKIENGQSYSYECVCCKHGFDKGHGQLIEGHKFCNSCIDSYNHFQWFRERELTDRMIYDITNDAINI